MTADFYHDPGFARLRHLLARHPKVASLVKTAEFEDAAEELPSTAFAWGAMRRYPVHSPHQAAVSYLYAKEASAPEPVLAQIKEALDAFGIAEDAFESVAEKVAALEPAQCLFPEQGTYPVRDAAEVKLAEKRLLDQVPYLAPETRADAFTRLYKRAEALGVPLAPKSYQLAGLTATDPVSLRDALQARAGATKVAELRSTFETLAKSVVKHKKDLASRAVQTKLAATIADLDKKAGLEAFYDKALPDPIQSVFNTTKRATEMVDLGKEQVPLAALEKMPPDFFAEVLGDDVVREIAPSGTVDGAQLKAVLDTLPMDLKHLLCEQMKSAGAY